MTDHKTIEEKAFQGCNWKADEEGTLDTDCGHAFCMIDGDPPGSSMRYCCYCGKPLLYVAFAYPEDPDEE